MSKKRRIKIDDLIALCYVVDDFKEFNENLLMELKNKSAPNFAAGLSFCKELEGYNKRKLQVGTQAYFYDKNEKVLNTIDKYVSSEYFIIRHYQLDGNLINNGTLLYFYNYLIKNREKIVKIIDVLLKIKQLGFYEIELNEEMDFTNEVHMIDKMFDNNYRDIIYLDNLEIVDDYNLNKVVYKSRKSNYKMIISGGSVGMGSIILNSLTFDLSRLPDLVNKRFIFDEIIQMREEKIDVNREMLEELINLEVGLSDMQTIFINVEKMINELSITEQKDKLKLKLVSIKSKLIQMNKLANKYKNDIFSRDSLITQDVVEREREEFVRRRKR